MKGYFDLLGKSRSSDTKWQVLYDIRSLKFYITAAVNENPYEIHAGSLDFQDSRLPQYMNIYSRDGLKKMT